MYKLCKTEQSARRQRQLEQGLLKAMLQHDYEEISISELCESMAVPRKSFYRYFSSKDGALYALIDHTMMEYESFERNTVGRTLHKDMERFYRFWQSKSSLLTALDRSGLSGLLVQRAVDYTLGDLVFPSRFLPNETPEMKSRVVAFSVCGMMAMMLKWHQEGYKTPIRELADSAVRLLTRPLFADADKRIS